MTAPDFRAVALHDAIVRTHPDTYLTPVDVQGAIEAACDDLHDAHGACPDPWVDRHWALLLEPVLGRLGFDYDEVFEVAA
jgi:hypothetical protein